MQKSSTPDGLSTNWVWYGLPGHFIGAANCWFHLNTVVGKYIISTVGDYHPNGQGEAQQIGLNRLFETMVFKVKKICTCGCDMPTHNGRELEFVGYNFHKEANDGHLTMCRKYDNLQQY